VPPSPASRSATPVRVDVPGWRLSGSDERREIWESDDPAVRVLVAAVATPLTSQDELDRRMLDKLGEVPDVRVLSPGPVDYEESYPRLHHAMADPARRRTPGLGGLPVPRVLD
jgi:hypothetical protein